MPLMFIHLFRKGKIGNMEARNRIVMLPMSTNFPNENGGVTTELIDYYAERAKGGAGVIIVEGAAVDFPVGRNGATKLRCDQVNFIPGLSRLVDAIHLYGAKTLIQVQHAGSSTIREKTFGQQPVAPSAIKNSAGQITAKELSVDEIEMIISEFVKTARFAQEAGFDGVEVHAAHSYLIAQFLTPIFNKRTDKYGGTFKKRARFLLEIVKGIQQEVGSKFIISVRMNGDEFTEGGLNVEDAKKIAVLLEDASADVLNISTGLTQHAENLSTCYPQGWRVHLAREIKRAVKIPVIASGNIRDPQFAEQVLAKGEADFIGLARALLADPYWPSKAAKGDTGKIRKCISCNIGCTGRRIFGDRSIKCTVNPDVGQEGRQNCCTGTEANCKKVVVIGAGAAGLNAALEAKRRGHSVVVFEKGGEIGGLLNIASVPCGKKTLQSYVEYLRDLIQEHHIEINYDKDPTFEKVRSLNPDAVVFASGSRAIIPSGIKGVRNKNVLTAHEVLSGKHLLKNENIIILGGGSIGCEVADFLAGDNHVTVIEMFSDLAVETEKLNRADLLKRLDNLHVTIMREARLEKITRNKVTVRENSTLHELPADHVILAVGVIPVLPEWMERLREEGIEYYIIGDARMPGKLIDAVSQGAAIGRLI
jgi:2,4-dienoyl-CoA reductase-like NADH-dependent reductase (Old Yellow Enzyme family)/thioredoxin reductase